MDCRNGVDGGQGFGEGADWTRSCDAIVQGCSAAYHADRHHFTMVYADYFFLEALYKLAGADTGMW